MFFFLQDTYSNGTLITSLLLLLIQTGLGWRCLRGEASGKYGLGCRARGWRASRESGKYCCTQRAGRARECRSEGVHRGLYIGTWLEEKMGFQVRSILDL